MSEACTRQNRDLRGYVGRSVKLEDLALRIVTVLERLPEEVLADFLGDPRFRLALDDYVPGHGRTVWMACPRPGANGSRCVLLKPRLAECEEDFAHYVIAHELAHAYLRNGGWGNIEDPELAADTLAATWGFGRPSRVIAKIQVRAFKRDGPQRAGALTC